MSLTSELRTGRHLKGLFHETFDPRPLLKNIRKRCTQYEQICSPQLKQHDFGLIGTAIDYRFRYYFQPVPVYKLIAYQAVFRGASRRIESVFGGAFVENTITFFSDLIYFLRQVNPAGRSLSKQNEEALCRYCLVLAKLEQLFRAFEEVAYGSEESRCAYGALTCFRLGSSVRLQKNLFACFSKHIVGDMLRLSQCFFQRQRHWIREKRVFLNPTFYLSAEVGGADGDIIIGNTYFDIKATRNSLRGIDLYQVFSYPMLDPYGDLRVKRVGIYLARYGLEMSWSHRELFKLMAKPGVSYDKFRKSFYKAVMSTSRV